MEGYLSDAYKISKKYEGLLRKLSNDDWKLLVELNKMILKYSVGGWKKEDFLKRLEKMDEEKKGTSRKKLHTMGSLKTSLNENPNTGFIGSIGGFIVHCMDVLSPILSFILLTASTITAIFICYIQYKRFRRYYFGEKNSSKKSSRNSR